MPRECWSLGNLNGNPWPWREALEGDGPARGWMDAATRARVSSAPPTSPTRAPTLRKLSIGSSTASESDGRRPAGATTVDEIQDLLFASALQQRKLAQVLDVRDEDGPASKRALDVRKCDYAIQNVEAPAVRARVPSTPPLSRGSTSVPPSKVARAAAIESQLARRTSRMNAMENLLGQRAVLTWRQYLEIYVLQLLQELRSHPEDLRVFMKQKAREGDDADGTKKAPTAAPIDQDDSESRSGSEAGGENTEADDGRFKFANVQSVCKRLRQVALHQGELLHRQLHGTLQKSVSNGVIDRRANAVRLESLFKLELRRQLTWEKLKQAVMGKVSENKRQLKGARSDGTTPRSSVVTQSSRDDDDSSSGNSSPSIWSELPDQRNTKSVHYFKLQALERLLEREWKDRDENANATALATIADEIIHDRLMMFLFGKNKENFPVWKDNQFSREETMRYMKTLVGRMAKMVLFIGLSVDQLIEIARSTKWKSWQHSQTICSLGKPMDELVFVFDGDIRSTTADEAVTQRTMGELGMVNKDAIWPTTLIPAHGSATGFVLHRHAFDAVLQRLLAPGSRRQLQQQQSGRPYSSPISSAKIRNVTSPAMYRPHTAIAKARNVKNFRQYRDSRMVLRLQSAPTDSRKKSVFNGAREADQRRISKEAVEEPCLEDEHMQEQASDTIVPSSFQYYPSFLSSKENSSGHFFRLKWMQPIPFDMEAIEGTIEREWAPSFPDTSAMIGYLSASAFPSMLFDKKNVLMKDQLRQVCNNHPFLNKAMASKHALQLKELSQQQQPTQQVPSQEVRSQQGSQQYDTRSQAPTSSGEILTKTDGEPEGRDEPYSPQPGRRQTETDRIGVNNDIDSDLITLAQFTEARKRIFARSQSGRQVATAHSTAVPSSESSAVASSAHDRPGGHSFGRSSFVPESYFVDKKIVRHYADGRNIDPDAQDNDNVIPEDGEALPEEDDSDDDDDIRQLLGRTERQASSKTLLGTKAKKSALDSLIQSMSPLSPTRARLLQQESKKHLVFQKHQQAAMDSTENSMDVELRGGHSHLTGAAGSHAPLPLRIDLQRRMEVVLRELKMRPKTKLDLVLKYTHVDHYDNFQGAVELWEHAMECIKRREKALQALRKFELTASDPRRHFRSLSIHRLSEQKQRDSLFHHLNYASEMCKKALDEVEKVCGDSVCYENRVYKEKMKKDYTELLFEVEQERLQMIYNGVHLAESSSKSEERRVEEPTTNLASSRPQEQSSRLPVKPIKPRATIVLPPQTRMLRRPSNQSADFKDNESGGLDVAGVVTAPKNKNLLNNPRESIFYNAGEAIERDRLEVQRKEREKEDALKRTHGELHRMSEQVRQHRRQELDNLKQRLINEADNGEPSLRPLLVDCEETRPSERTRTASSSERPSTLPSPSDLEFLQQAMQRLISKNKEFPNR